MAMANETVEVSRSFPAPRALVFKAWSSAEHMKRWFCPAHFTVPEATVDFRVGGACDICMRAPDGRDFWSYGRYEEIVPPERLVFTLSVGDRDAPAFTARTVVTFEEEGVGTRLSVRQTYDVHDSAALGNIAGASAGWRQTLDRLEAEVARVAA